MGDYDAAKTSHKATNEAIRHAAEHLGIDAEVAWLPTPSFLNEAGRPDLDIFDGFWASPGSPYKSMEGGIAGIRLAREMDRPLIGT
jgi:CTP synthase (UTP-ammonia lyase)